MLKITKSLHSVPKYANCIKSKLILGSLIHINKFGWNDKAIVQACLDLDISTVDFQYKASSKLLQNGTYEVVEFVMEDWRQTLVKELLQSESF